MQIDSVAINQSFPDRDVINNDDRDTPDTHMQEHVDHDDRSELSSNQDKSKQELIDLEPIVSSSTTPDVMDSTPHQDQSSESVRLSVPKHGSEGPPCYSPKTLLWLIQTENGQSIPLPSVVLNDIPSVKRQDIDEAWVLTFSDGGIKLVKTECLFDFCKYFNNCFALVNAVDKEYTDVNNHAKRIEACRLLVSMIMIKMENSNTDDKNDSVQKLNIKNDWVTFALKHLPNLENQSISTNFYETVCKEKVARFSEKHRKRAGDTAIFASPIKAKKSKPVDGHASTSAKAPRSMKSKPKNVETKKDDTPKLTKIKAPRVYGVVNEDNLKIPLDHGWSRDLVLRKTKPDGSAPTKHGDVYYHAPPNWGCKKLRSLNEIRNALEKNVGKYPNEWLEQLADRFSFRDNLILEHDKQTVMGAN